MAEEHSIESKSEWYVSRRDCVYLVENGISSTACCRMHATHVNEDKTRRACDLVALPSSLGGMPSIVWRRIFSEPLKA